MCNNRLDTAKERNSELEKRCKKIIQTAIQRNKDMENLQGAEKKKLEDTNRGLTTCLIRFFKRNVR